MASPLQGLVITFRSPLVVILVDARGVGFEETLFSIAQPPMEVCHSAEDAAGAMRHQRH